MTKPPARWCCKIETAGVKGQMEPTSTPAALRRFRDRMIDACSKLSDFVAAQRLRGDLSDAVQSTQCGNRAIENEPEGYLAANRCFSQATRNIESVQAGRDAAIRGRTESTVARARLRERQGPLR
jgi:hypothetical protein